MRELNTRSVSKRSLINDSLEGDLRDYLADATRRGLSQDEIATELEEQTGIRVTRASISNWLKEFGYQAYIVYKRKRRAA